MCSEIRHCVPGTHMCFYDLCLLPVVRLECELVGFSHFVHTHTCTHPLTHYPHTHKLTQNPHPQAHTEPTPHHTDTHTYREPTHPDLHTHLYPTLTTSLTASGRTSLTCCAMNPTCLFTGSQHIRLAAECWYW